ncbi:MAG: hypothetical protein JZU62_00625 [Sulfuricurvum sp.]|uniref:hypothetical protein n=1 Tax=Sulfuricurvum sp. TaxID=2025608 RepID=UPI0025F7B0C5|nr:hypothetical protein [Sulfuricurvum sp.]MBV5320170.1 hypothetical protein [Sulfuricurvum sp.]
MIKNNFNIVTVCTLDYIHYAISMAEALHIYNQNITVSIVLLDVYLNDNDSTLNKIENNNIKIIFIDEIIHIENIKTVIKYYNILEFSCIAKIYALYYIIFTLNNETCLYVDADVSFYSNIEDIFNNNFAVNLSPHILNFMDKEVAPENLEFFISGFINGGLILVNKSEKLESILNWLKSTTKTYWFVAPSMGMYADQIWLSILPLMDKDSIGLINSKSYNVAYWNLHERPLTQKNKKIILAETGEYLKIFHFSGFPSPYNGKLSKHFNHKFDDETERVVKKLSEEYAISLLKSLEKTKSFNLSTSITFSEEPLTIRLKKAETIWNIKFYTPSIPRGYFEKFGKKIDRLIQKVSEKI